MEPAARTRFTEDEYLALEAASQTKHEFIDGDIVAMAGGSPRHNLIATNIAGALRDGLRGRPCAVMNSDQAVNVVGVTSYFYPDVTVLCGKPVFGTKNPNAVQNPVLIVEVLSASTKRYDLGEKLDHFRRLPSLVDFLAVRKNERHVEHWHRTDIGRWVVTEFDGEGSVDLPSLGVALPLTEIYEKVDLFPEEDG